MEDKPSPDVAVTYKAIYQVSCLSRSLTGEDVPLADCAVSGATAILSQDPIKHSLRIDQSDVVRTRMAATMFGGRSSSITYQQHVVVASARWSQIKSGCLIVEGRRKVPVSFNASREEDEFTVCLNGIDRAKFKEPYERFAEQCIAGIALAITDYRASESKLIAEAFYCEREKPIFFHHMEAGGASLFVAVPFGKELAANISANVRRLAQNQRIERVTTLLSAARNETEPFKAFMLASGAFDLFFRGVFEQYRKAWFQRKQAHEHKPISHLFERLESFAEGQYAIMDCFIIVTATLDPLGAGQDYERMRTANKVRNDMAHRPSPKIRSFPTEQVLDVLSKYVRLHLQLN